jgi:uncharacterized protein YunC (DUF1805 family)
MQLPDGVVLLDSLGDLQPSNTSPILVCGSHCGGSQGLAQQVYNCNVRAAFLNNAGVGKNQAGIRGLAHYEAQGILACAVYHHSAQIGIAADTWETGTISHTNKHAQAAGIQTGHSVQQAIFILLNNNQHSWASLPVTPKSNTLAAIKKEETKASDSAQNIKQCTQVQLQGLAGTVQVTVTDSITFLNASHAGHIVVCGSHGGVSAGKYAQKNQVQAVFFNDAGLGKNNAGINSMDSLSAAGVVVCMVDCNSAEIFNGQDMLNNGIISVCNALAKTKGIKEQMMVKEALTYLG